MAKKTPLKNKHHPTAAQPTDYGWRYSHLRAQQAQIKQLQSLRKRQRQPLARVNTRAPADAPKGSPTQRVGQHFEQRAAQFLRRQGYQILTQQLRYPYGEIDLVAWAEDRKSTRLNSSHVAISYAVFCLKKKRPPTEV